MSAKKSTPSARSSGDYEGFVRGLSLVALGMDSCSARLDRYPYYNLLEARGQVRRVSAEYGLTRALKGHFDTKAVFRLVVTDKTGTETPLSIECIFRAHFHVRRGQVNEAFAKRFVGTEFRVVVWPYFRQFVTDTTARMTIPPIVIPFSSSED